MTQGSDEEHPGRNLFLRKKCVSPSPPSPMNFKSGDREQVPLYLWVPGVAVFATGPGTIATIPHQSGQDAPPTYVLPFPLHRSRLIVP